MTKKKGEHEVLPPRLRRAVRRIEPVRINRRVGGADALEGFVLAAGAKWTLLSIIGDDCSLDGHSCVRTHDVDRVRTHSRADFVRTLLNGRGQWPPPGLVSKQDLRRTSTMLRALAGRSPVLSVFIERDDPDVCFIGVPVKWGRRSVWLSEINAGAEWDDTVSKWRYRDITRVDVGGRYEANLIEVAGPRRKPAHR